MYLRKTGGGPGDVRGVMSNDCGSNGLVAGADGNSLYCAVNGSLFTGGLKDPAVDITSDSVSRWPLDTHLINVNFRFCSTS